MTKALSNKYPATTSNFRFFTFVALHTGTVGIHASKISVQVFHETIIPVRIKKKVVDAHSWPEIPVMINCTNLEALPTKVNIMMVYRISTRVIDFVFIHQACVAVICVTNKKY